MCGICGVIGPAADQGVDRMVAAMGHRGPDDSGQFEDKGFALGHTRLAIIDTSAGAHQPMSNPNGSVWIAYNGEAYNYREERVQLAQKGHVFTTSSDTEVVLRLYEQYGIEFLSHLRGMFALAIYDRRGPRPRLLLARDPFGIKPLLYSQIGESLIFASELKALLASGLVERRIDPMALRLVLAHGSVPQPMSIVAGVQSLLPGHFLIHEASSAHIERYWGLAVDRYSALRDQPYHEMVRALRSILEESVKLQMISDVPIGAFLSGGIDSGITAALMARLGGKQLKTFSVGFGAEGAAIDETDAARQVADYIGSDHSRVLVTGQDMLDNLPHFVRALDQPSVDGVNSYFVSRAARQSVTVAVSGTGGDELFAGYPWYAEMARFRALHYEPRFGTRQQSLLGSLARSRFLDPLLRTPGGKIIDRARSLGDFLPHYARQHRVFGESGAAQILARDWEISSRAALTSSQVAASCDELPSGTAIERVTALCLRGYTQNQLLRDIDAVSMSHSLEVRVPFLDPQIADFALSLPDVTKVGEAALRGDQMRGSYRETGVKRILIDAGADLLPPGFDMEEKRGFSMPFDAWLRGELREVLLDGLSRTTVQRRGLFRPDEVQRRVCSFLEGRSSWIYPWLLLVIELWCQEVLESPV